MIRYKVFGKGPVPIVALHPWFCDGSSFAPILPYLDPQKFTLLLMDLRGYGVAKEVKGSYTLQEAVQDTIAVTDFLQWKRFHIVGHAMGSLIAQKIALDHTDRVQSIVAIAPIPASGGPKRAELISFLEEAAIHNDAHALECFGALTNRRYSPYALQKMVATWREVSLSEARLSYLHMLAKENFSKNIEGLKTPILAFFGEHDFHDGEAEIQQTFLKWYPNIKLEHGKNVGHFSLQEAPMYLANLIETFTDKHPTR
jgi:pimeloyl-ACP methyl ester carboxylesterase